MFKFNRAYGKRIVKQTCGGYRCMLLLESDVLYHMRVKKAKELMNIRKKFKLFYQLYYIKQH